MLAALSMAPRAEALVPTAVSSHASDVEALLEKGGVPSGRIPVACGPTCSTLWESEHALIPGQPTSQALHGELSRLGTETKLLPKLGGASGALGPVLLGVTSFVSGWTIGTSIYNVFLKADVPAYPSEGYIRYVRWFESGDVITMPDDPQNPPGNPISSGDMVGMNGPGLTVWADALTGYGGDVRTYAPEPSFTPSSPIPLSGGAGHGTLQWYRATDSHLSEPLDEEPEDAVMQPHIEWPTGSQGTNGEPVSTTRDRMMQELNDHPERYPTLTQWLDFKLGGESEDPTAHNFTVPDCAGLTTTACSNAMLTAGWTGDVETDTLSRESANLTQPAGAVVTTSPPHGSHVSVESTVIFHVNPDPLPVEMFSPLAHETYDAYVARLRDAGMTGSITRIDLDGTTLDPQRGPNEAVSTIPKTGTRVATDDGVSVRTNPETAPDGGTDTAPFAFTVPPVDLGPLANAVSGCKFPFCLFSWAGDIFDGWVGTDTCPDWHIDVNGLGDLNLDMCFMNPFMVIWRYAVMITSALGMAWTFGRFAMSAST